jgi:hypothetical protein
VTGPTAAAGLQRWFLDAQPADRRGQAFALLSTGLMTLQGVGPTAFGEFATIPAALITAAAGAALVPLLLRRSPSPVPGMVELVGCVVKSHELSEPTMDGRVGEDDCVRAHH